MIVAILSFKDWFYSKDYVVTFFEINAEFNIYFPGNLLAFTVVLILLVAGTSDAGK